MSQALVKTDATLSDDSRQYLTFSVNGEFMAVGILDVDEIIEIGDLTRVPMSNNSVRGVINLRGNVVPVIDLSKRLGYPLSDLNKRTCIVLVNLQIDGEHQTMGMLVDEVNEILQIPADAIQKTPDFGTDIRHDFIDSMGRVDNQFIILLNIDRVFAIEELSTVDHARFTPRKTPLLTDSSADSI